MGIYDKIINGLDTLVVRPIGLYNKDYRFVVEPDIKPFKVNEELVERAKSRVGELPEAKRIRLQKQFGLSDFDVETLTSSRELALWFEEAAEYDCFRRWRCFVFNS